VVSGDGPSSFGVLLRGWRLAAGLTQEALAEQAGLSARGIADLERGVRRFPYLHTVDRLATALGLHEQDRLRLLALRRRVGEADLADTLPLVGRRTQWRQLQAIWQDVIAGGPRCVIIEGEAGIGKSHLAQELLMWANHKGFSSARPRAYAAEGHLSYAPVTDWLGSTALRHGLERLDARSRRDVAQLVPHLLSDLPDLGETAAYSDPQHRHQFFQSLARAVLTAQPPLLLVLDDLQWCDQDTLEWLHYLLRFDARGALLVVGTARMDEVGAGHPLIALLSDLRVSGQLLEISLGPLDAAETAELAVRVAGRMLEPDETRRLFDETEGQPLFVVETVHAQLGATAEATEPVNQAAARSSSARIPPKVYAVIATRLAQLSASTREIVQVAATIGRSFTLDLLIEASGRESDRVVDALDDLWRRRIVREHGALAYDFSHDWIREVAYSDISSVRRSMLHRRVARGLERNAGANLDSISAQVAAHFEYGGLPVQAVPYYCRAAELAQRLHAHHEASHLLGRGLGLLGGLPPSRDRDTQELALQTALGTSHVATSGYGSRSAVTPYRRAEQLCRLLNVTPSPPLLRGLAIASISHAEFGRAYAFGEKLVGLASESGDPMLFVEGQYVLGVAEFWKGAVVSSREHLERALGVSSTDGAVDHLTLYAPDPRVVCGSRLAFDLWLLGEPREARTTMAAALDLGRELAHPFSLAYALSWSVALAVLERDFAVVEADSGAVVELSREYGMQMWLGLLNVARGWALAEGGGGQQAIDLMHDGMNAHAAAGTRHHLPWMMGMIAEQYGKIGRTDQALTRLADALVLVERTGERWCEAELHRWQGDVLARRGDLVEARQAYGRALAVARQQQARSLELRATRGLKVLEELQLAQ
jgi:transcriptional regulator with XRE-family HTH domain/tetratricopeptide (TPR) repeat protein